MGRRSNAACQCPTSLDLKLASRQRGREDTTGNDAAPSKRPGAFWWPEQGLPICLSAISHHAPLPLLSRASI